MGVGQSDMANNTPSVAIVSRYIHFWPEKQREYPLLTIAPFFAGYSTSGEDEHGGFTPTEYIVSLNYYLELLAHAVFFRIDND